MFAGVVTGKNIWRNHYEKTTNLLQELTKYRSQIVLNTSCSLLHVPYTLRHETKLNENYKKHFSFAEEKLNELAELANIIDSASPEETPAYQKNKALFTEERFCENKGVQEKVAALTEKRFCTSAGILRT